jgi:Neuraminidase (sialidase)
MIFEVGDFCIGTIVVRIKSFQCNLNVSEIFQITEINYRSKKTSYSGISEYNTSHSIIPHVKLYY